MTIVANPLIGVARKKMGNVVFTTQWGQNIMKTKPISIKDPKTPRQLAYRERFTKLNGIIRQILHPINRAYAGSIKNMSPYNRVMSINMKNCFIDGTSSIDPSLFVFCENDGSFVDKIVLSSTTTNTITCTFNSKAQNADEDADPVKAYGFNPDRDKIWKFQQVATRSTGTLTLGNNEISGLNIAVYLECLDRITLIDGNPKHVIKYVGTVAVL